MLQAGMVMSYKSCPLDAGGHDAETQRDILSALDTHPDDAAQHGAAHALAHGQGNDEEATYPQPQGGALHAAAHCSQKSTCTA